MNNLSTSPATNCQSCGSEIVEWINDSLFRHGECGGCEYQRYKMAPKISALLDELLDITLDTDLSSGIELTERETDLRNRAIALFGKAYGNAA